MISLKLRKIELDGSDNNSQIVADKKYLVKANGEEHQGVFTKQWFGWSCKNLDGKYMQLSFIDEVYEIEE